MKRTVSLLIIVLTALLVTGCASPQNNGEHQEGWNTPVPGGPTKQPITDVTLNPMTFAPVEPDPTEGFGNVDMPENGKPLYWDNASPLNSSGEIGTAWTVCRNYAEFGKSFGRLPEDIAERYAEEKFNSMFVVAVSVTVPTGGYTVGLNSAEIKDGAVNIDILEEGPKPGTQTTQALQTHTVLVAFDSMLYSDSLSYNITVNGKPAITNETSR